MHDELREVIRQIDSICIASYSLRSEHFQSSTHRVRIKLTDFLVTLMKSGAREESINISAVISIGREVTRSQRFVC